MGLASLRSKYGEWRADRKRFPKRWLTYNRRVRDDVEALYKTKGGPEFFNDDYIDALTKTVEQLEGRELKLIGFSITISVFMTLCLISSDASVTILGIPLKNTPGIKELLLVLSATIAVLVLLFQQAKQLRVTILEKLVEIKTQKDFIGLAKISSKSGYDLSFYAAKQYDRWIFPTFPTKMVTGLVTLAIFMVFMAFLAFNWVLWVYVFVELYTEPKIRIWSYAAMGYAALAYLSVLLWWMRSNLPFPYIDKQKLLELKRLSETDLVAYEALRNELYGPK